MNVPLRKALKIIFFSTFFISGGATLSLGIYQYIQLERVFDERYNILAIVQTSTEKENLNTAYFAELLNLSVDQPTNIYRFNKNANLSKLAKSPLLKKAAIKKIYPGTIQIHYVLRIPVAFLADYTNVAIDKDGIAIPFKPFFTPKILPEIYLGLQDAPDDQFLGNRVATKEAKLALKLLDYLIVHLVSDQTTLKRIDVSTSYASSFGQKQIVVVVEDTVEKMKNDNPVITHYLRTLRLSTNGYEDEIKAYLLLRQHLLEKNMAKDFKVIDLRIPDLAFLSK